MKETILILLAFLSLDTVAQNITWTGTLSSDWHNGCNWDLGVVPTCNHDVFLVTVTTNPPVVSATACAGSLTIAPNSNLTVQSPTLLNVGCVGGCTPTDNTSIISSPTAGTHVPSQTQIVWNWNTVSGATGYKYNTVNNYATATDNVTSTTYTQTGLTCNTAYTLYVWAYDQCGESSELTLNESTGICYTGCIATGSTALVSVTNTYTGKVWMDRNLGASQVATSYNDAAAYGCLIQWGRATEGHEDRGSTNTSTLATTAVPNLGNSWDGKFIVNSTIPNDWLSPADNTLWQGASGTNNPCPNGYRIPTDVELDAERLSWVQPPISSTNDIFGAYASPLKLPSGGHRHSLGGLSSVGSRGYYWSSTINSVNSQFLSFSGSGASVSNLKRSYGMSVRCIKN